MAKQATPHPEDLAIAKEVAESTQFSVCLHLGPHNRTTERGIPDYATARARADELDKTSRFGRKTVVYAITPRGWSHPVDHKLAQLAGLA